jgi:hypothetical protein
MVPPHGDLLLCMVVKREGNDNPSLEDEKICTGLIAERELNAGLMPVIVGETTFTICSQYLNRWMFKYSDHLLRTIFADRESLQMFDALLNERIRLFKKIDVMVYRTNAALTF